MPLSILLLLSLLHVSLALSISTPSSVTVGGSVPVTWVVSGGLFGDTVIKPRTRLRNTNTGELGPAADHGFTLKNGATTSLLVPNVGTFVVEALRGDGSISATSNTFQVLPTTPPPPPPPPPPPQQAPPKPTAPPPANTEPVGNNPTNGNGGGSNPPATNSVPSNPQSTPSGTPQTNSNNTTTQQSTGTGPGPSESATKSEGSATRTNLNAASVTSSLGLSTTAEILGPSDMPPPTADPSPDALSEIGASGKKHRKMMIIGAAVGGTVFILWAVGFYLFWRRRRRHRQVSNYDDGEPMRQVERQSTARSSWEASGDSSYEVMVRYSPTPGFPANHERSSNESSDVPSSATNLHASRTPLPFSPQTSARITSTDSLIPLSSTRNLLRKERGSSTAALEYLETPSTLTPVRRRATQTLPRPLSPRQMSSLTEAPYNAEDEVDSTTRSQSSAYVVDDEVNPLRPPHLLPTGALADLVDPNSDSITRTSSADVSEREVHNPSLAPSLPASRKADPPLSASVLCDNVPTLGSMSRLYEWDVNVESQPVSPSSNILALRRDVDAGPVNLPEEPPDYYTVFR